MTITEKIAVYNEVVEEALELLIKESVKHFLAKKPKNKHAVADDPRYLYNDRELQMFMDKFLPLSDENNPNHDVKVSIVHDNKGKFLCYKLYREFK